jgi:glycerol-3-phosphate acyltransferase PlsY
MKTNRRTESIMSWIQHQLADASVWNQRLIFLFVGYALGCFASGYYLVRFIAHKDIRLEGSGSVGARNVGRLLGTPGFLAVTILDIAKGMLAVWLAWHFTRNEQLAALAMLAVTVGHIWPVQLKFHGGKGAATSLGALLIYDWQVTLGFMIICALLLLCLRKFTLSGLVTFALLPLVALALRQSSAAVFNLTALAGIVLSGHRKNLEGFFACHYEHSKPEEKS